MAAKKKEKVMLLYMWTCGIDEKNALFDQEMSEEVQWCASLERAVDEATANIRHFLDSGVSPKDIDNVGIFSVEFDPTPDNIVALLEVAYCVVPGSSTFSVVGTIAA
jgi:hypothetical protein